MKRREFIRGGIGTFMAGLTLPLDRFIADYKPENVSKVNRLEELGEIIERGQPVEVLYNLGEERERTELLVTYTDRENSITNRITSSQQIRLYEDKGVTLMDITDSDEVADRYSYNGLRPLGAEFEIPSRPSDELGYELGDLTVDLEGGRQLGISQYAREE